jgi:ACR3 family arsenite efflux pump ArsB
LGAWRYGRSLERWKPVAIGLALMIYPYFISIPWLLWSVGVGLLVLLWFQHDE